MLCNMARCLFRTDKDLDAMEEKPRNVAILLFDAVELLDFTGPFQVFASSRDFEQPDRRLFSVFTVAQQVKPLTTEAGQVVVPTHSFEDCPKPDCLVVPGGIGSRAAAFNSDLMSWLQRAAKDAELVLSVCTGALLLGKAGLLNGLSATTHHSYFDLLRQVAPRSKLKPGERFVDNGRVITAAGVSAGIDASLYAIAKLNGIKQATSTAQEIEYNHWDPSCADELSPKT